MLPSEQKLADIARKRACWQLYQDRIDPKRLVFIDETGAKTNMTRTRGWGPRGQRVRDDTPHGHWKSLTFLAALRSDRIDAPLVLDGPMNGARFAAYVEQIPAPTLAPGDVVILDNLSSHKNDRARRAIRRAKGHVFFLPPYSPDLNPIEQVFAKLKTLLRRECARSVEETWRRIGTLLERFAPDECGRNLANSGYTGAST